MDEKTRGKNMSSNINGSVEISDDVIVGVVGVLAGGVAVAAVAVGAALMGAVALAKLAGRATQSIGESFKEVAEQTAQLEKLMAEQKRKEQEAFDRYSEEVKNNESKQKEFIAKLQSAINFKALDISEDGQKRIDRLDNAEKTQVLNGILDVQNQFDRLSELFYGLSELGLEVDCEFEFYSLKKEFAKSVSDGKYDFTELYKKIEALFLKIRGLQATADNKEAVEFVAKQFYKIDNILGKPQLMIFNSELYDMLCAEEKEGSVSQEEKLFEVEKNVLQLAQLFFQIDYNFPEKEEFLALLQSVKEELASADSVTTKLEWLKTRHRHMMDSYKKICARESKVLSLKQRYNEAIALNYLLKEELSMELPLMDFHYQTAEQDIASLTAENEALAQKLAERQKQNYIRKTVRETMREMQYEYLCSQKRVTSSNQTIFEDVYHIEDGNIVAVTFVDGKVNCSVSGVEIAGIPEDKESIVRSMKKVCSQSKELQERLAKKGISYSIDKRVEPSADNAREIKLTNASATTIERIRKEKLKRRPSATKKKKAIG